jgi:hypothetical protein
MNQTNVEKNAGMYALCVDGTHGEMYHVQDNEGLKLALGYHQHELNIHEWRAFSVLYSFEHNTIGNALLLVSKTQRAGSRVWLLAD